MVSQKYSELWAIHDICSGGVTSGRGATMHTQRGNVVLLTKGNADYQEAYFMLLFFLLYYNFCIEICNFLLFYKCMSYLYLRFLKSFTKNKEKSNKHYKNTINIIKQQNYLFYKISVGTLPKNAIGVH